MQILWTKKAVFGRSARKQLSKSTQNQITDPQDEQELQPQELQELHELQPQELQGLHEEERPVKPNCCA